MNRNNLSRSRTRLVIVLALLVLLLVPLDTVWADSYTYDNTTSGTVDNGCITRTFDVTDDFTVTDLDVGFNASNSRRGQIRATLTSPDSTSVEIISNASDYDDNYDVLLDSASGNPLDDNSNDDTSTPYYDRTAAPSNSLNAFNGKNSVGTWTLQICDNQSYRTTTFNRAQLQFEGTPSAPPDNEISGNVFRDYDADGTTDSNEPGVANITVTAYNASGAQVDQTQADANGDYTLTGLTDTEEYRIEFTGLPSYLQPGPCGTDSETTVAFATSPATGVDVGLANPAEYCQDDPDLVTSVYQNGDPLYGGGTDTADVLVSFAYSASGTSPAPTSAAIGSEVGSTWGLAYERTQQKLFSAAFLKRHMGLGSQGLGGIYVTDFSGGSPSASDFIDLSTLGVSVGTVASNSARGLSGLTVPNTDETVFDDIGKIGLGDMDISDDGSTLWVVSLNDRKLVKIDISGYLADNLDLPDSDDVSTFTIPERPSGCIDDEYRPFGLKLYQDRVYVGAVCSDETHTFANHESTANLYAYVVTFDPSSNTWDSGSVVDFPLDYTKGPANIDNSPKCEQWYPWSDDFYNEFFVQPADPDFFCRTQPILSDIEFDAGGDMILGFIDRAGHQIGHANYEPTSGNTHMIYVSGGGEILRACANGSGGWDLESNGACGGVTGGGSNGEGPGGGEFYDGDFQGAAGTKYHHETVVGGLAQLSSQEEVVASAYDVESTFDGGILHLSHTDGSAASDYQIYASIWGNPGTFGKAHGLGDLELLCDPAPIEIGNRVWEEDDGNGIQDPEETNIAGVDVQLWADTTGDGTVDTQVGAATTDANGNYYFGGVNDTNMTGGNSVEPNTAYELRISLTDPDLPDDSEPTTKDQGTDLHDSDGDNGGIHAGYSTVQFTTGAAGANNHTYDFGFDPPPPTAVTVSSFAARSVGPVPVCQGVLPLWRWLALASLLAPSVCRLIWMKRR